MRLSLISRWGFSLTGKELRFFRYLNAVSREICYSTPPALSSSAKDASPLVGTGVRLQDGFSDVKTSSYFAILASKVDCGNSEDAILRSLLQDEVCDAIKVDHGLIGDMLRRFKDDWKSALGFFRWADSRPGFKHSLDAYDMMVDILGKAREFDKMRELVNEMRQKKVVTLETFAKMTRRFAGADCWTDALMTFDELGTYGLGKNSESMNILLDSLCKENQVEKAREIYLALTAHIPPNANTFNILIHGWCKVSRVEEAHWTIQEMKGKGFHTCVISYSTIIQSYCLQANYAKVYELLDEMESQGCPPNVVTFTTIMSSLTKTENFDEALRIVKRMRSVGCKPDVQFYNALIHTLGRAREIREAIRVFEEEMPKTGILPNTSTYNTMIAMFCRYHREDKALKFLADMEKSGICKPDVQTFYPLLKYCFKSGQVESSLSKLLDDMTNRYHLSLDVSAYTLLIHGLCRAKEGEWAYRLFEQMIGQGLRPRDLTCRLLLDELKWKRMDDAIERVEAHKKQMKASPH